MQLARIVIAATGVSLIAGLLAPAPSQAAWRRISASACTGTRINGSHETDTWRINLTEHGYTVMGGDSMQVTCPLEDTSGFQKTDIDHVNVHTYDSTATANNYSRAYMCVASPFALVVNCGASQTASGSGYKNLSLNSNDEIGYATSVAAGPYFASLKITMYSTGTNFQRLIGYWVTD